MAKIKLEELKAAMALLCHDDVKWVRTPITVDDIAYIVAQVPVECGPDACAVFRSYGLSDELVINGVRCAALMPVPFDKFDVIVNDRPPLVLGNNADNKQKNHFLQQLYDANITQCEVTYSGSGDSSNPSDFSYNVAPLSFNAEWSNELQQKWYKALQAAMPDEFEEAVHEWIYKDLATGYDTYNNDGGGGTLTFDLSDPSSPVVHFTLYTNETIQNEHLDHDV